jgi:hypothetical protein
MDGIVLAPEDAETREDTNRESSGELEKCLVAGLA